MMPAPAWAAGYIGIPFRERGRDRAGCDCWGLVRLVLGERFGVAVPSYAGDYESVKDYRRLAELVEAQTTNLTAEAQRHGGPTVVSARGARNQPGCSLRLCASAVNPVWSEVEIGEPLPGDVVLLRLRGLPIHVGLIVAPCWMLHTARATDSVLDRFGGLAWKNRILGIYRHEDLASAA